MVDERCEIKKQPPDIPGDMREAWGWGERAAPEGGLESERLHHSGSEMQQKGLGKKRQTSMRFSMT